MSNLDELRSIAGTLDSKNRSLETDVAEGKKLARLFLELDKKMTEATGPGWDHPTLREVPNVQGQVEVVESEEPNEPDSDPSDPE